MATSYSTLLGLALPVQGELSGTWGDTVNNYITTYLDAAVAGTQSLTTDADVTLTKTTATALGATSSQYAILNCSGARTVLRTITAPAASKVYLVINSTTGGFGVKIVGAGPTTGVTVAPGTAVLVAWSTALTDFVTVASTDAAKLVGQISLTTQVSGTLPVANGGTGATTNAGAAFALKGANSDITSLSGLSTALSVAQGGTGQTALSNVSVGSASVASNLSGGSAGTIPYQTATGATSMLAAGTAGQILTSGGAAAPTWGAAPASYVQYQLFTSSGTFTPPAGVTQVKVTVLAGGGGGGGGEVGACATVSGKAGGNGGVASGYCTVTPSTGVTVTVGAGGNGGAAGNNAGASGGTSSFGTAISCTGGGGGSGWNAGSVGATGVASGASFMRTGPGGIMNATGSSSNTAQAAQPYTATGAYLASANGIGGTPGTFGKGGVAGMVLVEW